MTIGDAGTGSAGPVAAQGRLSVDTRRTSGAVVCTLKGELDLDSLAPARAVLEDAVESGPTRLVVDLAGVQFCDSSGLNLLLQTRLAAQAADVPLALTSLVPQVARVFEITGAESVFTIHGSVEEAFAAR